MRDRKIVGDYMRLFRLWNGAIAVLGLVLAALVAGGLQVLQEASWEIATGALVVLLFVGAGNALNDYFDSETDRVAHPSRPIVTGAISRAAALSSSAALFSLSIILSLFLDPLSVTIVILAVVAMVAYELRLKGGGLAGNFAIACLVAGLFVFGGAAVGLAERTWVLAALAGLATLGREIVKDIEDMEGDTARRTLPRRIGARRAGALALVPTAAAIGLSPLPFLLEQLTLLYLPVVLLADALFIYGGMAQFRDPGRGQKVYKLAMIVALIAFAVGVQT